MRIVFFLIFLLSCSKTRDFNDNDWAYYRGDNSVSHYKSFDQINVSNVHKLQNYQIPRFCEFRKGVPL